MIAIRRGICAFPGAGSGVGGVGGVGRLGAAVGPVGDEPGVDPRRPLAEATYGHIQMPCEIEIVDYSAVRWSSRRMNNREFVDFMESSSSSESMPRRDQYCWDELGCFEGGCDQVRYVTHVSILCV